MPTGVTAQDARLSWPDALALAVDGYLYVIANQAAHIPGRQGSAGEAVFLAAAQDGQESGLVAVSAIPVQLSSKVQPTP